LILANLRYWQELNKKIQRNTAGLLQDQPISTQRPWWYMSSFTIPGLGFAKPNETLPPLPPDVLAAAASIGGVELSQAIDNELEDKRANETTKVNPESRDSKPAQASSDSQDEAEPMAVDNTPESPPSLTHALEQALGGLEPEPVANNDTETNNEAGGHPEWEVDSSPYQSSSESSSSVSTSSEEDSDNEGYELLGVEETARLLMEADNGSEDEGGDNRNARASGSGQVRTKNELTEEMIPKPDIQITEDMKIEELGSVEHIIENTLVIKAFVPGEYQVLDTGSVLCTANRAIIGVISETLGKVLQPMYTVRFGSNEDIEQLGLELGTKIYYPVAHASYVFTEPLKNIKGSDASNIHDEEVGDDEAEFSDDEKEAEYKRQLKQKKKEGKWKNGAVRGGKEPHPLRKELKSDTAMDGLNYDEDDDGPYRPLLRPPGFGHAPISQASFTPDHIARPNSQRDRRGDSRGRGQRGRGARRGRGGFGSVPEGYSLPPQGHQQQFQNTGNQHTPGPSNGWNRSNQPLSATTANFQYPGWPQPLAPGSTAEFAPMPPPPPGWPGHDPASGVGAYFNPAFFGALLAQAQTQTPNGQSSGTAQPPPPPYGDGGRGTRP
jgi:H/ACA ribonucleoprotein complex non-core subunit NAF1